MAVYQCHCPFCVPNWAKSPLLTSSGPPGGHHEDMADLDHYVSVDIPPELFGSEMYLLYNIDIRL